jgi:hypothetical protein
LIVAASSAALAACAANRAEQPAAHPGFVVDNYNTPSAADLYAERYQATVTQVVAGGKHQFVNCEHTCPGATPKTPIASLNAAVARRAQANGQTRRVRSTPAEKPMAIPAPGTETSFARPLAPDSAAPGVSGTTTRSGAPTDSVSAPIGHGARTTIAKDATVRPGAQRELINHEDAADNRER